ncbi:N-acetylglucosamine-6-phosphate deacetylase [Crenobacter sp. SG2305]|uniref:N-acetylglucosamine-6-phosphate deacetylase n=1 Tax=Crenobacter oryzisoli TaxID=3056844 RepID=UPI0025AB43C6|nr:N-acetylglucosamine-6-phosphate deacetylase [Crenobacter sp. SG2305]MDN0083863.1 N-acetylglucosamine-6-phosphate deacetylase [Crenobacter sp. SG2305]
MSATSRILAGRILTPQGWLDGELTVRGERIAAIRGTPVDDDGKACRYILPGFIDTHVHGGGGADVMEGGEAAVTIARQHARFGTTSLLATTMTAPRADIEAALTAIGAACRERTPGGARILGVHLEGPYINPGKLGAQPAEARAGVLDEVEAFMRLAPLKLITVAPEVSGHLDLIRSLADRGVRVQLGHTLGRYEDGVAALEHGASGFTHLFNAMTGLHHREPGMVGAALAHAEYAELIPDLLHVHPGAIRTALRAIPHLFCVTDSTAAAGMPDGDYKLGSQPVTKCLGGVRLADGTLAGSTLTMNVALKNLVGIGLTLADASNRLSRYPADYLGVTDRGRLEEGGYADLVLLDTQLNLNEVFVEGECLGLADA